MKKINIFAGIIALIYFILMSFPFIDGLFNRNKKAFVKTKGDDEWKELPLMTGQLPLPKGSGLSKGD